MNLQVTLSNCGCCVSLHWTRPKTGSVYLAAPALPVWFAELPLLPVPVLANAGAAVAAPIPRTMIGPATRAAILADLRIGCAFLISPVRDAGWLFPRAR